MTLTDPNFAVATKVDVTKAYTFSKENNISFFGKYVHDCLKAINEIPNFKYRIENNKVFEYPTVDVSATILRADKTFGFSYVTFHQDLNIFLNTLRAEVERINTTTDLFPLLNNVNCVYASALPWVDFTSHKEPVSAINNGIPQIAFGKVVDINKTKQITVSLNVHHALVDGYHVGQFFEKFQKNLNN